MQADLIKIEEYQNDYVGSRQEFFRAHTDMEEAEQMVKKLARGEAIISNRDIENDSDDSSISLQGSSSQDHSSRRSSMSW